MGHKNHGKNSRSSMSSKKRKELAKAREARETAKKEQAKMDQDGSAQRYYRFDKDPLIGSQLPADVLVILRRLLKRDVNTRLKAIEELHTYISNVPDNDHMLSDFTETWIQFYDRLFIDSTARVRFMANSIHAILATKIKKKLAPYLKDILGIWLCYSFDVVKPANEAFEAAFSKEKKLDAMRIFQSNILESLSEFLLSSSPETLSDSRYVEPEEMESNYCRIVSSSLYALAFLIESLDPEILRECEVTYDFIFDSPALWADLTYPSSIVRRASYHLLSSLAKYWPSPLESRIGMAVVPFFANCFKDVDIATHSEMWNAILLTTRTFPQVWQISSETSSEPLLELFLSFLKRGCLGSAAVSYPSIKVLLDNVYSQDWLNDNVHHQILNSIWDGIHSNAIDKTNALHLFNAYLECIFYIVARSSISHAKEILRNHFERLLDIILFNLKGHAVVAEKLPIARVLNGLAQRVVKLYANTELSEPIMNSLRVKMLSILGTGSPERGSSESLASNVDGVPAFISSLYGASRQDTDFRTKFLFPLMQECFFTALQSIVQFQGLEIGSVLFLQSCLVEFPEQVLQSESVSRKFNNFVRDNLPMLLTSQSSTLAISILCSYLQGCGSLEEKQEAFDQAVKVLISSGNELQISNLVDEVASVKRRTGLNDIIASAEFDHYVENSLHASANEVSLAILSKIIAIGQPLISEEARERISSKAMDDVIEAGKCLDGSLNCHISAANFEILNALFGKEEVLRCLLAEAKLHETVANICLLALFRPDLENFSSIWSKLISGLKELKLLDHYIPALIKSLQKRVILTTFLFRPEDVLSKLRSLEGTICENLITNAFISSNFLHQLDESLGDAYTSRWDYAFVEGCLMSYEAVSKNERTYDSYGNSEYSRRMQFVIESTTSEVPTELVEHLFLLESFLSESIVVPQAANLWKNASKHHLIRLRDLTRKLCLKWVESQERSTKWARSFAERPDDDHTGKDAFMLLLAKLSRRILDGKPWWSRALVQALSVIADHTFTDIGDFEHALQLVKVSNDLQLLPWHMAILLSIKSHCIETQRYQHITNDLAGKLSGVPPGKAVSDGFYLITLLNATAPPNESSTIFLPSQRAVFLLQALKRWYDTGAATTRILDSEVIRLLNSLAPIVQSMSGAHWDFIFGRLLASIRLPRADDDTDLLIFARGLELYETVMQLSRQSEAVSNCLEDYKEDFEDRLLDIFINSNEVLPGNEIEGLCRKMIMEGVTDVPVATLSRLQAFDPLCKSFTWSGEADKITSYRLLKRIVDYNMDDLIVEVAVSKANDLDIKLPQALMDVILIPPRGDDPLGYLLAWTLVMDYVEPAIHALKNFYVEQLRKQGAMDVLLPYLFDVLQVIGIGKTFDCSKYAIDEFYIECLDNRSSVATVSVLSSNLYYRLLKFLPGLVRYWWTENRNRGVTMAVEYFTEKYFSTAIIESELAFLSSEEGKSQIQDEQMKIKVAKTTHEVSAVYTIDEAPMEMMIRLPKNYPLQQAEVKDVKRIGVPEAKWRYWLLATQQVITAQNGSIIDALGLFKRNISLHFEGVEDCAICYSIINVSDKSLPSKQCKVCKHLFHAMCLLKWFKTGNSASCPLCRSSF